MSNEAGGRALSGLPLPSATLPAVEFAKLSGYTKIVALTMRVLDIAREQG